MAGVPISLDWPAFKGFVASYGLLIDYAPQPTTPNYFVYATDGEVDLECYITVSSDITDFETNFKAQATQVQIVPGPNISMVTVTNFPSVQPVSQSGIWTLQATFTGSTIGVTQVTSPWVCSISNFPATQTVNGTVSVGNFPATQTVAGTITANQGTSPWVISAASLPLPSGAATSSNQATANSSLATLVANSPPLGQALMAASVPVTIASNQSALAVSQSGVWNVTNVTGTVSLPTGASTAANQATGNTSLSSIASAFVNTTTAGQKVMSSSLPVVIASDQSPVQATLGNSSGKTVVMKTGTLVTTATTAGQVILTYTVTAGKTFYLEYFDLFAYITSLPGGASVLMGTFILENPVGTTLYSNVMVANGGGGVNPYFVLPFSEPQPIASATVIRITVTPAVVTSFTWVANFGGYER